MTEHDRISPRQFTAAAFVCALSLLIRRFPRALAARAGRSAVLAVPLATLPMLAVLAAAWLLFRRRQAGGLGTAFTDILGTVPGRALTGLYGFWFLFYAGFLLRSGAERMITTVYSGAQPWVFVCMTALLCAVAAAGRLLPLMRASMLVRPLMLAPILLIALLTAKDLDPALLLPLRTANLPDVALAALEVANLLSIGLFLGFFGDRLERPLRPLDFLPWLAALLGVIALMTVGCFGMFGPELTAKMRYPYFMLVRDLSVLGALERVEPVVIALWVFPDFILISLLLHLAADTVRASLGLRAGCVKLLAPLSAALSAAAALALPGGLDAQRALSEQIVPALGALFGFGPLPLLLLVGRLRKS